MHPPYLALPPLTCYPCLRLPRRPRAQSMLKKLVHLNLIVAFVLSLMAPISRVEAQPLLGLPEPGTMVSLSPAFEPPIIRGLTIHKDNPFLFDFIIDPGQGNVSGASLHKEGEKLIRYFLASLALPEQDLWVNLSPYEKDRTVPETLAQTEMGRDLLAQDYLLKQLTASLIYPEKEMGKKFWQKIYAQAQDLYGKTEVPVHTFNKVWIVAQDADVFERNQSVFVVSSRLKVMLEEDYIALNKNNQSAASLKGVSSSKKSASTSMKSIVRDIILPEIEREVNAGKNFAQLRQIFNAIILAGWYKKNLKQTLMSQLYVNQSKVKGIALSDPTAMEKIYQRYLQAYKKGVFNYIKETPAGPGPSSPRKYFSGGVVGKVGEYRLSTPAAFLGGLPRDRAMAKFAVSFTDGVKFSDPAMALPNEAKAKVLEVPSKVSLRFRTHSDPRLYNGKPTAVDFEVLHTDASTRLMIKRREIDGAGKVAQEPIRQISKTIAYHPVLVYASSEYGLLLTYVTRVEIYSRPQVHFAIITFADGLRVEQISADVFEDAIVNRAVESNPELFQQLSVKTAKNEFYLKAGSLSASGQRITIKAARSEIVLNAEKLIEQVSRRHAQAVNKNWIQADHYPVFQPQPKSSLDITQLGILMRNRFPDDRYSLSAFSGGFRIQYRLRDQMSDSAWDKSEARTQLWNAARELVAFDLEISIHEGLGQLSVSLPDSAMTAPGKANANAKVRRPHLALPEVQKYLDGLEQKIKERTKNMEGAPGKLVFMVLNDAPPTATEDDLQEIVRQGQEYLKRYGRPGIKLQVKRKSTRPLALATEAQKSPEQPPRSQGLELLGAEAWRTVDREFGLDTTTKGSSKFESNLRALMGTLLSHEIKKYSPVNLYDERIRSVPQRTSKTDFERDLGELLRLLSKNAKSRPKGRYNPIYTKEEIEEMFDQEAAKFKRSYVWQYTDKQWEMATQAVRKLLSDGFEAHSQPSKAMVAENLAETRELIKKMEVQKMTAGGEWLPVAFVQEGSEGKGLRQGELFLGSDPRKKEGVVLRPAALVVRSPLLGGKSFVVTTFESLGNFEVYSYGALVMIHDRKAGTLTVDRLVIGQDNRPFLEHVSPNDLLEALQYTQPVLFDPFLLEFGMLNHSYNVRYADDRLYIRDYDGVLQVDKLVRKLVGLDEEPSAAMASAANSLFDFKGGVDFNDAAAKTRLHKQGQGVGVGLDAAMLERARVGGLELLAPQILQVVPLSLTQIESMLGLGGTTKKF